MSLLLAGQIVRMSGALWRVDYVNECRARLVPLDRSAGREANVSPNSLLEVVEDLERVALETELSVAEQELAELRAEVQRRAQQTQELAEAERELAELQATIKTGWHPTGPAPEGAVNSLKVWAYWAVSDKPGCSTQQLHQLVIVVKGLEATTLGALAACLDRLRKSGHVEKG